MNDILNMILFTYMLKINFVNTLTHPLNSHAIDTP